MVVIRQVCSCFLIQSRKADSVVQPGLLVSTVPVHCIRMLSTATRRLILDTAFGRDFTNSSHAYLLVKHEG